jgi:hypothetical protein
MASEATLEVESDTVVVMADDLFFANKVLEGNGESLETD